MNSFIYLRTSNFEMHWLIILSIGLFVWSLTALVDKYALTGRFKDKKLYMVFVCFTHIVIASILVLFFFGLEPLPLKIVMLAILAGLIETLKIYYMFTSFSLEEVSRVFPIGVMSSFLVLGVSFVFLGESLSGFELLAFFMFIVGSLFLAVKRVGEDFKITKAIFPILMTGIIGSIQLVVLRIVSQESGFWSSVFYTRLGLFIGALSIVLVFYRRGLFDSMNKISLKLKGIVVLNQVVAFGGYIFFFTAVGMVNAALVSSAMGIQHVMVFLLATVVTLFNPKLIKEELKISVLIQKGIGIALIVIAIYVLNL